jgi:hypothetical protein
MIKNHEKLIRCFYLLYNENTFKTVFTKTSSLQFEYSPHGAWEGSWMVSNVKTYFHKDIKFNYLNFIEKNFKVVKWTEPYIEYTIRYATKYNFECQIYNHCHNGGENLYNIEYVRFYENNNQELIGITFYTNNPKEYHSGFWKRSF